MLLASTESKGKAGKVLPLLNTGQNPLLPLVEERLGGTIAALGLSVIACRASRLVLLENAHCRLILLGEGEDFSRALSASVEAKGLGCITCWLEEKAAGSLAKPFDLYFFLFLRMGTRVSEYLPGDGHCGNNRRLVCLDAIGAALIDGELSGPLSGDFSWAGDYIGLIEEKDCMYESLLALKGYRPEIFDICRKWRIGDPRWIEEARALLEVKSEK